MAILVIRIFGNEDKNTIKRVFDSLGARYEDKYDITKPGNYLIYSDNFVCRKPGHYITNLLNDNHRDYKIFTLKEFLQEYPYLKDDKIKYHDKVETIDYMYWDGNKVKYFTLDGPEHTEIFLQYMEPISNKLKIEIEDLNFKSKDTGITDIILDEANFADKVFINLGEHFEIQCIDGKYYAVNKNLKLPQTLEECLKILDIGKELLVPEVSMYNGHALKHFQRLMIYRNAYWSVLKYHPSSDNPKFYVSYKSREISSLPFPTEESRDFFAKKHENLMKECEDLL